MIETGSPFHHWDEHRHGRRHRHRNGCHGRRGTPGAERPTDDDVVRDPLEPNRDGEARHDPRSAFFGHGRGFGGGRGGWRDFAPADDVDAPHAGPPGFHGGAGRDDDPLGGGRGWFAENKVRRRRGFGRGFGGPRGPGGPGRHGRPLGQGDLRWLVLDLIAAQPRHGYEIIKAIEEAFNGHYTPSPGVIYPTLTLLEETGLISGESHGAKKLYSLTEEGRAEIAAHSVDIQAVRDRLAKARARFGAAPPPELYRAMDNLRAALQVRLAKGELSAEAVQTITAAIDRAAAEIERS